MNRFALKTRPPVKRYVPKITKHEESIQRRIASYIRQHYPQVLFHSDYSAGLHLTQNQARINKSLQSGRGWPDMFVAYPSRGYYGLCLELKKEGTVIYVSRGPRKGQLVQNEQIQIEAAVLTRLNKLGYFARFVCGYDAAVRLIEWYMGNENASLF